MVRGFLERHRDWLHDAVARQAEPVLLTIGAELPFRGASWRIEAAAGTAGVTEALDRRTLLVGGRVETAPARIAAFLKEAARARLVACSRRHADRLGVDYARIAIRDTRSRWGSCSSTGALSYSWRLILAPDAVLDYVAAHEVAHLRELNHSSRFWAIVDGLDPNWRANRDWLRTHGADLHRYRTA